MIMKMRVGSVLMRAREARKINQTEMEPEPQSHARRFRGILKSRRPRAEIDLFIEKMRDEWERII